MVSAAEILDLETPVGVITPDLSVKCIYSLECLHETSHKRHRENFFLIFPSDPSDQTKTLISLTFVSALKNKPVLIYSSFSRENALYALNFAEKAIVYFDYINTSDTPTGGLSQAHYPEILKRLKPGSEILLKATEENTNAIIACLPTLQAGVKIRIHSGEPQMIDRLSSALPQNIILERNDTNRGASHRAYANRVRAQRAEALRQPPVSAQMTAWNPQPQP